MDLYVFRALWGMTGPLPEQIERIAAAGYDGVELRGHGDFALRTRLPELRAELARDRVIETAGSR